MIKIYKKTNKAVNNLYGCIHIKSINDLNNPFLLCISGYDKYDKAVYGMIREGAHAARMYTTQECAAGFNFEKVPIDFLGYTYEEDKRNSKNAKELAHDFLIPFLKLHGTNEKVIIKQARKINIFTFDSGAKKYKDAEKEIFNDLIKLNFNKKTVEKILSQISLISCGTNENLSKIYATNISFIDVMDNEIMTSELEEYKKVLTKNKAVSMYYPEGKNNSIVFLYKGTGKHTIKDYLKDDLIIKPALSSITSLLLDNSISNSNNPKLLEIDREMLFSPLYTFAGENNDIQNKMNILDKKIRYDNSPHYTKQELLLRKELDTSCKNIQSLLIKVENRQDEKNELANKLTTLINCCNKELDEETYYKLLRDSKLWFGKTKKQK